MITFIGILTAIWVISMLFIWLVYERWEDLDG